MSSWLKLITLLVPTCIGCVSTQSEASRRDARPFEYFAQPEQAPEGVVVLVHGMNLRPKAMDSWVPVFQEWGLDVVRVSLTGHHPKGSQHGASAGLWRSEVRQACLEARLRAPGKPLYLLGYSLGGALIIDLVASQAIEASGLILLAPAIKIRRLVQASRMFGWFAGTGLSVPSRSPAGYRAQDWTSADSYCALYHVVDRISGSADRQALARVPALVFMSDDDELLSPVRTRDWLESADLPEWEFHELQTQGLAHLIVDPSTMGASEWQRVTQLIRSKFFDEYLALTPAAR